MSTLDGKVALVTGGGRGIGRAISTRLAADGAHVCVNYARDENAARSTVAAITEAGGQAFAVQADMSRITDIRALYEHITNTAGGIDIVVNNAGAATFAPLAEVTEADFDALFAVNVKGVLFSMQEAARRLRSGGRIVNISSGVTQAGAPGASVYAGTKGAIEQFTICAAKELGARGITVNTVSPGMTETDLLHRVIPADVQAQQAQSALLGRLGRPDDIADVVAFVVSDAGRWLTGQNIRATGGEL